MEQPLALAAAARARFLYQESPRSLTEAAELAGPDLLEIGAQRRDQRAAHAQPGVVPVFAAAIVTALEMLGGQVETAEPGELAVDDAQLAVIAPVDRGDEMQELRVPAPRPQCVAVGAEIPGQRMEYPDLAGRSVQARRNPAGVAKRADAVEQHAHAHAARGGGFERCEDSTADRIELENVDLERDLARGPFDVLDEVVEIGLRIEEQPSGFSHALSAQSANRASSGKWSDSWSQGCRSSRTDSSKLTPR